VSIFNKIRKLFGLQTIEDMPEEIEIPVVKETPSIKVEKPAAPAKKKGRPAKSAYPKKQKPVGGKGL
jgi:hypothetical protein